MSSEERNDWGTGEDERWNKNFSAPVYGVDGDGQPVTASFGSGRHEGETLIANGYVSQSDFNKVDGCNQHIGHDHYMPDGSTGKSGDRGKYYFLGDNDGDDDSNSLF